RIGMQAVIDVDGTKVEALHIPQCRECVQQCRGIAAAAEGNDQRRRRLEFGKRATKCIDQCVAVVLSLVGVHAPSPPAPAEWLASVASRWPASASAPPCRCSPPG